MSINKSARLVGVLEFPAGGLRNTLHLGHNANTGEPILWQQYTGCRARRMTGRNLRRAAWELYKLLASGEGRWVGEPDKDCLDALERLAGMPS